MAKSDVMARAGGGMFFLGGLVGCTLTTQSTRAGGGAVAGYTAAVASMVLGVALLLWGARLGPATYPPLVFTATVLVTVIVHEAPNDVGAVMRATFYVSIACAAFFFTWVQAALQIAFAAVCCITVLALRPDCEWWYGLVVTGTMVAIGIVVAFMGRVAAEAELDQVTGLLNRTGFEGELRLATSRAMFARPDPSLILLNVDRIGANRDAHGDLARRDRLQQIAESWSSQLGPKVILARYDVDRFAVLAPATTEQDALALAERLCAAVPTGCSAGVTSARRGEPVSALLSRAELALSRAERVGRRRTVLESAHQPPLVLELAKAIADCRFELLYQPIVSLVEENGIVGVEALLRMPLATRPNMTPIEVVRAAEQTNLIGELGAAVLRRACHEAVSLQEASARPLMLSVNVSGLELVQTGYTAGVLDVLAETGWPAGQLILEVTESVLDADTPLAIDALHSLRADGVRIAIDDFGNGYSSLSRIHLLPADIIKLDASFTAAITPDAPEAPPLLQAVAALGAALGLPVLAEGVETPHQAAVFARIGFQFGQGYFFGRAQSKTDTKQTLAVAAVRPPAGPSGLIG